MEGELGGGGDGGRARGRRGWRESYGEEGMEGELGGGGDGRRARGRRGWRES